MNKVKIVIIIVFYLFIIFSCSTSIPPRETVLNSNFTPARHLIFIGFDGWGAAYLKKAYMPTIKRMIADGASSTTTRSVMPSVSWPNWTSLFMGTPPEKRTNDNFLSIFTIVKESFSTVHDDSENQSVLFYEWKDLYNICPDETAAKFAITSDYESAYKIASYILTKKPVFTAISFDEPDHAGHTKGWGSKTYYEKLTLLDSFVAIIEQAVKDSGIYDSTVFVFSADHGGSFKGHGMNTSKHRKIPLIFYGAGIKKGYVIPFSTDIYDVTPSMATILGLKVPQEWTGKPIFEIFDNLKQ